MADVAAWLPAQTLTVIHEHRTALLAIYCVDCQICQQTYQGADIAQGSN